MRRALEIMLAFALLAAPCSAFAGGGGDQEKSGGEPLPLRRSEAASGSYPGGPASKAPLSTGYYVVDNDAPALDPRWAPTYAIDQSPPSQWRRILSGPSQRDPAVWTAPESEGYEYFRNPNNMNDSTDNAFAGPISIGFPFYFYGRRYDSFYVSTNGLIALTNRRYQYNELGNRVDYEAVTDDIRPRAGNAASDTTPDDYGYRYVALGNSNSPTAGILSPDNRPFPATNQRSVIAPLWDDTELSQYDPITMQPDDFGQVQWRRDAGGQRLIVQVTNQSMKGTKNIPLLGTQATVPNRALRASYQVVFDRTDSSVSVNYSNFRGSWMEPLSQVINVPANVMFASNATFGLQSHDQEYTNYLANYQFGGGVYVNGNPLGTPHNAMAVKFKQWKNVVRVLSVSFQVPSQFVPGTYVDLPAGTQADNTELLLGDALLGVIRPVGVVQNVSSDVGPVNVTRQPIRFNVVFRIRDLVNVANTPVYQRTQTTEALYPIDGAGPGRPSQTTVTFDPYITNANIPRQTGRFRAEVIALDQAPNGAGYGQEWPFDDTTGVRLFGIKRLTMPFINSFSDFNISQEDGTIPSVQQWVSLGASVVDGEANCYNPPPPRGPAGPALQQLNSPVCLLDRRDVAGGFYNNNAPGVLGGDTLISFPINLSQSVVNPVLLLSYQRAGRQQNGYPRGFSDNVRIGPEQAVYNTVKDRFLQQPDKLVVEFAEPSRDGVNGIVNIQSGWRDGTFNQRNDRINWGTTSPRWGVFGGGGGSGLDTAGKVIVDEFDAGRESEFNRAYIPIPNKWARATPGNKTFRFRIRAELKMDGNPIGSPADDGDNFYVDNVMLVEPDKPEVEITAVRVDWPYTEAPASQARAIPLSVKIGNNGSTAATTFGVAMFVENLSAPAPRGHYNYYRYQSIVSVPAGRDRVENFPTWNAQDCGASIRVTPTSQPTITNYRISARILPQNFDTYGPNDLSYTDLNLRLGPTFAYDDGSNDVQNAAQLVGKGLNLIPPTNQDGSGVSPFGPSGGSSSGTFAMQFRILTRDTIRGFQAYFGAANQSQDNILYTLYKQTVPNPNNPPSGQPVAYAYARRGQGIEGVKFDQYVTYLLDTQYVAEPGIYFATIAQLGQTGLELGGDGSRMGQVTTIASPGPPLGVGNYSIPAHQEMRQNRFWYEVTTGSGNWNPMLTLTNNPGYAHLDYLGTVGPLPTYTRGSWIPMIRPYFGYKESNACMVEPVELSAFNLTELADALRLDWTTSAEINNHGFTVERRAKGVPDGWQDLAFQQGAGTTNQTQRYAYTDHQAQRGVTYQYRLRQEDRDGSVNYSDLKEGRINGSNAENGANVLSQSVPNPVTTRAQITFVVAESQTVTLEITDIHGSVIRDYTVEASAGRDNTVIWDAADSHGAQVPNGTYIYKLSGNGFTMARKLSVSR